MSLLFALEMSDQSITAAAANRVMFPEPALSAKVGQARIHPHSCSGGNDQPVSMTDQIGGTG
jgi:hypothetical protein